MSGGHRRATAPSLGAVLADAASLGRDLEDTRLWNNADVREGSITIQQQAERFAAASDDDTRSDAALWAREGYQILSGGLPSEQPARGSDEKKTGWETASAIAKLFGAEFVWKARVRLAFLPVAPDASRHDPDVEYLRGLIELTRISQREVAERIGIGFRLLKYYITTPGQDKEHRIAPYPVQYAIERLAAERVGDRNAEA